MLPWPGKQGDPYTEGTHLLSSSHLSFHPSELLAQGGSRKGSKHQISHASLHVSCPEFPGILYASLWREERDEMLRTSAFSNPLQIAVAKLLSVVYLKPPYEMSSKNGWAIKTQVTHWMIQSSEFRCWEIDKKLSKSHYFALSEPRYEPVSFTHWLSICSDCCPVRWLMAAGAQR